MSTPFGSGAARTGAIILLVAVALVLLYLIVMGLRNRTIAKLGVRNIPRRRSQSALIILGLTLSTIIIVSALSIGDTLSYSVRRHAINAYGEIDQVISPEIEVARMILRTAISTSSLVVNSAVFPGRCGNDTAALSGLMYLYIK